MPEFKSVDELYYLAEKLGKEVEVKLNRSEPITFTYQLELEDPTNMDRILIYSYVKAEVGMPEDPKDPNTIPLTIEQGRNDVSFYCTYQVEHRKTILDCVTGAIEWYSGLLKGQITRFSHVFDDEEMWKLIEESPVDQLENTVKKLDSFILTDEARDGYRVEYEGQPYEEIIDDLHEHIELYKLFKKMEGILTEYHSTNA